MPSDLTVTDPFAVLAGPPKLSGSLLASVAVTLPVTTPFEALGAPALVVPATGTAFDGLMVTPTGTVADAPYLSVTVTEKVSVVSAAFAPTLAAACRAAAVGV